MNSMKRFRPAALLAFACLGLHAQSVPQVYQRVNYYKVPYEMRTAFLDHCKELKKVYQAQIAAGEATYFGVSVVVGAGSGSEYNYVTILSNTKPLDTVTAEKWQMWVKQSGANWSTANAQVFQPMLLRSVITGIQIRATNPKPAAVGDFMAIRRFRANPGKLSGLLAGHRDLSVPAMNELVAQGKTNSYGVSVPIFSGSSALGYNYSVTNSYSSQRAAVEGYGADAYRAAWAKANPGKSLDDYMKTLQNDRVLVRAELWRLLDRTDPK